MQNAEQHDVYPLLEYANGAWRVNRVFTTEDDLRLAGGEPLSSTTLPTSSVYGQRSRLESPEKLALMTRLQHEVRELKLAAAAASDLVKQKDLQLDAMHFVWCDGACPAIVHRWTPGEPSDDLVREAAKQLTRLCDWWAQRHAGELPADHADKWTHDRFDALVESRALKEKLSGLSERLSKSDTRAKWLTRALSVAMVAFVVELILRTFF